MRRAWLVPAFVVACQGPVPLSDVLVVGGSDEQRDAALEELQEFDRWVGRGRVSLREVEFTSKPGRSAHTTGAYFVGRQRIELWDERHPANVRRDLRHELCHAIDHQDLHLDEPATPFEEQVDGLLDYLSIRVSGGEDIYSLDEPWREVFAKYCELGPYASALLLDGCEESDLSSIMLWLDDQVWREHVLGPHASGSNDPVRSEVEVLFGDAMRIRDTKTPGVIALEVNGEWQGVEVATGLEAEGVVELETEEAPTDTPTGLETSEAAAAVGRSLAVVAVDGLHLGSSAHRWLLHDEDGWARVDVCAPSADQHGAFPSGSDLLRSWLDGQTVLWAAVE